MNKQPAKIITSRGGPAIDVSRAGAALAITQWRAARLRIAVNRRLDGTTAYFCRYTNETVVTHQEGK
jgi:hypothetical protein